MKNSDQAIEKVLSALSEAKAPSGMEQRILTALQNQAMHAASSRWHRLNPSWLIAHARTVTISASCGLAALIATFLIAPVIRHANRFPAPPAQSASPISRPSPITTATTIAPATSALVRNISTHPARTAKHAKAEESLAEAEMSAPSLPAPPMPLTEQEQLLLRIVHANDPIELAMLDSKTWAAQFAQSKARFDKFFTPPKTDLTGDQQ